MPNPLIDLLGGKTQIAMYKAQHHKVSLSPFSSSDQITCCFRKREKDRERSQSRNEKGKKVRDDGLTPEQRRERDAKALQEKAAKKAAQAAGGADASKKK
ncbi:hypothetical protein Nepgr_022133 [Nepenthes gracilis]|uniref:Small EDRK-rich factor-like N-terminal domain-containing protein n=1 Tax=Nepenthes gracilis TaxID=150966 RepID=A0AAD3XWI6_NEPGR|nr:hypothetical protein Nepgr_022133 [Nepenthes gracilis]